MRFINLAITHFHTHVTLLEFKKKTTSKTPSSVELEWPSNAKLTSDRNFAISSMLHGDFFNCCFFMNYVFVCITTCQTCLHVSQQFR